MSTDVPYPTGMVDRMRVLEERQRSTEGTVTSLVTTAAVHTEQISGVKSDFSAMMESIKDVNKRVGRLLMAAWALFLVLLPIAFSLMVKAVG